MNQKTVNLPYSVYRNIVDHLTVHSSTDSWAESCLEQLEKEAMIQESTLGKIVDERSLVNSLNPLGIQNFANSKSHQAENT